MTTLRWKKIISDLRINKGRSFLAAAAMTIGMIGLGAVLCAYAILVRELDANYTRTIPPSAIISVPEVTGDLMKTVEDHPGVDLVEARGYYQARILTKTEGWKTLLLFVRDDFRRMRLSRPKPDGGNWPPGPGEILIERAAFRVADARMGDMVTVRLPGAGEQPLKISGSIHDPAQAPAWMEGLVYGYVSKETLALFGPVRLNEVLLTVSEGTSDKTRIRSTVKSVTDRLEQKGYSIRRIEVPEPGHHPHQTQLKALLFLLEAFGGLCFVLSTVLVITLLGAIMAQQVRQIGVMKAIGARTGQVADMYLALALLLGALAAALGIPIAKMAARGYAAFAAQMLNFEIIDASMPWGIYLILVVVGLATPVISALWPVWRGSGITVRESITDYGIRAKANSRRLLDRLIELVPALPRPLLLSLANTFRRRGRIVLTMTTLTLGGAMFITALNIGASITKTIGVFQNAMQYDLRVTFTKPIANDRLSAVSKSIPGIKRVEPWGQSKASLVLDDGSDGNEFTVMAPPVGTDLLRPRVIEGRMTTAQDEKALIVNHIFMNEHPHLKVGDEVLLRMGNQKTKWRILGVIRQIGPPTAFTTYDYLSTLMGQQGLATTMAVVTDQRSVQAHQTAANRMEQAYRDAGIEIVDTVSIYTIQRILEDHFRILTLLLLFMAGLIVLVGGLALMTTMSIQVLERTREIGVMRAIGASNHELMRIIGTEGLVIGLASWVLALFLSVPLSKYIGDVFGLIFLRTTLDFALSPYAFMLWLGVVVIFSLAASFFPAKKATGLTVRETLAYE